MKKKNIALSLLCAAVIAGTAGFATLGAAAADLSAVRFAAASVGGTVSANIGKNNYGADWAHVVESYIYEDGTGRPVRLEHIGSEIVAETFSADGTSLLSRKTIEMEQPKFGGAFIGEKYNFLVFAVDNLDEDDTLEFLTAVKYDRNWEKLGSCTFAAEQTSGMFEFGSLRMTESDGVLYAHTCHMKYKNDKGSYSQASFTFQVDEESMTGFRDYRPYMSHSFDQYVRVSDSTEYLVDLGDSSRRSVRLTALDLPGTEGGSKTEDILSIGSDYTTLGTKTGVELGGFEVGSGYCITAGITADQNALKTSSQKNVFVCLTKNDLSASETVMLTDHAEGSGVTVSAPLLTDLGGDSYLLLWEEMKGSGRCIKTATISGSGEVVPGSADITDSLLSDCAPVRFSDGSVRWYYTDGGSPVFCKFDPSDKPVQRLAGDCNLDGKRNNDDVILIQQRSCGWRVQIDEKLADVTGDRKIDNDDVIRLQQAICGWRVELVLNE